MPKGITFQDVINRLDRVEAQMRVLTGYPVICPHAAEYNFTKISCIRAGDNGHDVHEGKTPNGDVIRWKTYADM